MWRHNYNTSFYQVANQLSSPVLKATVQSTIIKRNDSTYPTTSDYFQILQTCAFSPIPRVCLPLIVEISILAGLALTRQQPFTYCPV